LEYSIAEWCPSRLDYLWEKEGDSRSDFPEKRTYMKRGTKALEKGTWVYGLRGQGRWKIATALPSGRSA